MRMVDKTGNRYGFLKVIEKAPNRGKKVFWKCRCDCGATIEVVSYLLTDSGQKSCGCKQRRPPHEKGMACSTATRKHPNGRTGTLDGWHAHYYSGEEPCEACIEGNRKGVREWRSENVETAFDYHLRSRFNITLAQYNDMLDAQGGGCAICGSESHGDSRIKRFHVDHDHSCCASKGSCGECVRGLLCRGCNTALGNFSDDPVRLLRAADYLTCFTAEKETTANA